MLSDLEYYDCPLERTTSTLSTNTLRLLKLKWKKKIINMPWIFEQCEITEYQ